MLNDQIENKNAERVGFEPTDSFAIKRFRVVRFRPLSHLSLEISLRQSPIFS